MLLLILESIGTPELILIAIVALILFGPRKLPQMAKTIGKTMAEFRNATNEFKTTWEREAAIEDEKGKGLLTDTVSVSKSAGEEPQSVADERIESEPFQPKVRELSEDEIKELFKKDIPQEARKTEDTTSLSKRDWL